ncbi:MAG: c-type cytochrome [Ardenticatenia bacterium]|nr:c-type cytochrome [Ardenticatenia bacterium]
MVRLQIALGVIITVVGLIVVAWIALNEDANLARRDEEILARRIERGAVLFEQNCYTCHGFSAQGVPGLGPPLNDREMLEQRVKEVGWPGSLYSYLVRTIAGGRIVSTRPEYLGGKASDPNAMAMPPWWEEYGGPLRKADVEDIALFLQNFEEFPPELLAEMATPTPEAGEQQPEEGGVDAVAVDLFTQLGCLGCHSLATVPGAVGTVGPPLDGLGERAASVIADPAYTGNATTPEEYIRESIVDPSAFVVAGYPDVMPKGFGDQLSEEQLNALVQFLLKQ